MNILSSIVSFFAAVGLFFSSLFGGTSSMPDSQTALAPEDAMASAASATSTLGQKAYSDSELLSMARDAFSSGVVPLGDYKYVTSGAKKGYVYLCNARKDNPGSMVLGPWVSGDTWNFKQKVTVDGSVTWKNATFVQTISGAYRTLTGNDLPINHTTGVFPVALSDDAHQYDANPNTISSQQLKVSLPAKPTYSSTPYCMTGGEVGIMTSGVALFNAFDAGLRDAPAHELQDTCGGHPQGSGEYHYHSLPSCLKDTSIKTVIGFAYDGFPITGPVVTKGKYLTTSNLDECHGITSEILLDGRKTVSYHYVMTYDFPYSASCFRGKPVVTGPSAGTPPQGMQQGTSQGSQQPGGTPPQEAITACASKSSGASCSFTGGRGETVSGTCQTPQGSSLACVPR
jgi:hypothetical protein